MAQGAKDDMIFVVWSKAAIFKERMMALLFSWNEKVEGNSPKKNFGIELNTENFERSLSRTGGWRRVLGIRHNGGGDNVWSRLAASAVAHLKARRGAV